MDKGFTLLEVILTAITILVLSAIALAAYKTYQERGYLTISEIHVKVAMTAIQSRLANNDDTPFNLSIDSDTSVSGSLDNLPGYDLQNGVCLEVTYIDQTDYSIVGAHKNNEELIGGDKLAKTSVNGGKITLSSMTCN